MMLEFSDFIFSMCIIFIYTINPVIWNNYLLWCWYINNIPDFNDSNYKHNTGVNCILIIILYSSTILEFSPIAF